MGSRIAYYWDLLKTNLGALPFVLIIISLLAAVFLPQLEIMAREYAPQWWQTSLAWRADDAEKDRILLQTVIGVAATVTSIILSISMLVISQATSQFGQRIVRIFFKQQSTQWTVGIVLGSLFYCLLMLWQIPYEQSITYKISLSAMLGLIYGMLSLIFLVHYVYAVSQVMQVQVVVRSILSDLNQAIQTVYGGCEEQSVAIDLNNHDNRPLSSACWQVYAHQQGYVQAILYQDLLQIAERENICLQIHEQPGQFVCQGDLLISVFSEKSVSDSLQEQLENCVLTGTQRTPRQDIGCAIQELVEIGTKALSPGINDPFTAITTIQYLTAPLVEIVSRPDLPNAYQDKQGNVRLLVSQVRFAELLTIAFQQLERYGHDNTAVTTALLTLYQRLYQATEVTTRRNLIQQRFCQLQQIASDRALFEQDKTAINELQLM